KQDSRHQQPRSQRRRRLLRAIECVRVIGHRGSGHYFKDTSRIVATAGIRRRCGDRCARKPAQSCILARDLSFSYRSLHSSFMPTFAAIDIGSNSCRLEIAKVAAYRLKTLAEDREVTRLGASVFESGLVSPDAMAATLRALKRFQRVVQAHGVDQIRVVATAAMRDARNAQAFQAWVKAETGWNMEIISGLEEGRLIHMGVISGEPGAGGKVLLLDLGGGSCEITLSEHKRIKETISLPLGAV